jgi:hypothetical protein
MALIAAGLLTHHTLQVPSSHTAPSMTVHTSKSSSQLQQLTGSTQRNMHQRRSAITHWQAPNPPPCTKLKMDACLPMCTH